MWYYVYDANGSLVEVLPNGSEASGAKRYTYNTAGYLTQVETHNGSGWDTQAEMSYNGLGQRLSMDAAGVIAYYVMDGNRPLTAESNGNTTSYLYGLGVIGEESNAWSYGLTDGMNTQRQLTDATGEVTYSARYTPWGDTLETYGTGNFTFGYFGGLMDTATGLLYVGDGQYYDPSTGRFLTRGSNPNSPNPYLPFDPTGALFLPLALVSLVYGRKRRKSKWDILVIVTLLSLSAGMGVAACNPPPAGDVTATVTATPDAPVGVGTATFSDGTTITGTVPVRPDGTPTIVPSVTCTPTPTNTPVPISTPPQKIEDVNLSAYYTVLETDYLGGKVPVKANAAKKQQVGADYLLKDAHNAYTNYNQHAQTARSDFLYDPAGLCTQGSGRLENGLYISCTDPVGNIPNVGFEWHSQINDVVTLETVAICPHSHLTPFRRGDIIEIPALKARMQSKGKDEFFTVTDTGGGLCKTAGHAETLDVYIGEGYNSTTKADYMYIRNIDKTVVYIHRGTNP